MKKYALYALVAGVMIGGFQGNCHAGALQEAAYDLLDTGMSLLYDDDDANPAASRARKYLNAVGDSKNIVVTVQKIHDLGSISGKGQGFAFFVPGLNDQRLFSLRTTTSSSNEFIDQDVVGKNIKILFVGEPADSDAQAEAKKSGFVVSHVIKVYRQIEGESLWVEAATLLVPNIQKKVVIKAFVRPNGDVEFTQGGIKKALNIGKRVIEPIQDI